MICFFGDEPAKTMASAAAFSGAGECDKDLTRGTHDDEALRILHRIQMKRSRINTSGKQEVWSARQQRVKPINVF
jgi:hypothetical protein